MKQNKYKVHDSLLVDAEIARGYVLYHALRSILSNLRRIGSPHTFVFENTIEKICSSELQITEFKDASMIEQEDYVEHVRNSVARSTHVTVVDALIGARNNLDVEVFTQHALRFLDGGSLGQVRFARANVSDYFQLYNVLSSYYIRNEDISMVRKFLTRFFGNASEDIVNSITGDNFRLLRVCIEKSLFIKMYCGQVEQLVKSLQKTHGCLSRWSNGESSCSFPIMSLTNKFLRDLASKGVEFDDSSADKTQQYVQTAKNLIANKYYKLIADDLVTEFKKLTPTLKVSKKAEDIKPSASLSYASIASRIDDTIRMGTVAGSLAWEPMPMNPLFTVEDFDEDVLTAESL